MSISRDINGLLSSLLQIKGWQDSVYSSYLTNKQFSVVENDPLVALKDGQRNIFTNLPMPFAAAYQLSPQSIMSLHVLPPPPLQLPYSALTYFDRRPSSDGYYLEFVLHKDDFTAPTCYQEFVTFLIGDYHHMNVLCEDKVSKGNISLIRCDEYMPGKLDKHSKLQSKVRRNFHDHENVAKKVRAVRRHPTGIGKKRVIVSSEENHRGASSVLQLGITLGGINVWTALARTNCVVLLPQRDFSPQQYFRSGEVRWSTLSARRMSRRPRAPRTGDRRVADTVRSANNGATQGQEEIIQGSQHEHEENANTAFDFTEITELLHASEYQTIIKLLENVESLPSGAHISAYFVKGVAYFKMCNYADARLCFNESEGLAKHSERDGDILMCNAYLGDIEYTKKNFLEAAKCYEMAYKYYSRSVCAATFKLFPPTLSAIHAKRASALRSMSRMVEAIQGYKVALTVADLDKDRLSAHTSLGNLYQSMGDNSNALEQYKESIDLAEKLSDYVSLGWAHGNIGNAYLGLNRKDEALHHLQKSLDLAVEYERTPQAIGRTYNNLGTAYQSMSNLDKAEEYYKLALSQATYGKDTPGEARVHGNIGNVFMLRKDYEKAISHYEDVLHLSVDPSTINTARHNRGCARYEWATSLLAKQDSVYTIHGHECVTNVCLAHVPEKAKELYYEGSEDLLEVIKYHEEKFQHIKGSKGASTLSVSLHESNSRTFHRLQDCLVCLHSYDRALVIAERSRARTLGELMLKRKNGHLQLPLTSPPGFEHIMSIIENVQDPVLYMSYTGARLIGWLFIPGKHMSLKTFEVPLADDQFNGKAFDYFLRYSLTETLVERSFEMYRTIAYDEESSSSVQMLFRLVGEPILMILGDTQKCHLQQLVVVSDSYTSLLPLTCLLSQASGLFFGDHYFFRQMPSLLTMGIMNQLPDASVTLSADPYDFCVIGDPNIPPFILDKDIWMLGRLPYAKKEAEWVAHILKTSPLLDEQANKQALLHRLMNAKVVHIATHGSASSGFLAFASFSVPFNSGTTQTADTSNVLLFPKEIENLDISPALVVLSSCDSGRGTVKADGIQGMARAFILAGAQSVLTTLWKVPDESASIFMQFFYQYLVDGLYSSLALQKAILSVRCFTKYSQYIHWSGYQLTGRNVQFFVQNLSSSQAIQSRLGQLSVFPRLPILKKLQISLLNRQSQSYPTDMQMLQGCPGVKPSEVVIDFIVSSHEHFSGGIFWICCHNTGLIHEGIKKIEKTIQGDVTASDAEQVLIVLDGIAAILDVEELLNILKQRYVHIIVIHESFSNSSKDALIKAVDQKLLRGCICHVIEPLSVINCTQRIVYSVMKEHNFTPSSDDQQIFEDLSDFTLGSPVIADIVSQVLLRYLKESHLQLCSIASQLSLKASKSECDTIASSSHSITDHVGFSTFTSSSVHSDFPDDVSKACTKYESIQQLLDICDLSEEELLLLRCLAVFGHSPIPIGLVNEISLFITKGAQKQHIAGTLHENLVKYKLIQKYPSSIVCHHSLKFNPTLNVECLCIPHYVCDCLLSAAEDIDIVTGLGVAFRALQTLEYAQPCNGGLSSVLLEGLNLNFDRIGYDCYKSALACISKTVYHE